MSWNKSCIVDLEELSSDEIMTILNMARWFKEKISSRPAANFDFLKGYTVCNLFFENSTRTKMSFEIAEHRLGMHVMNFSEVGSSTQKGESFIDTVLNLEAMNVDVFVMRNSASGSPYQVIKNTETAFINAGDGKHAHPTQALLDLLTIYEQKGSFKDLNVVMCGDAMHSRVIRSNLTGMKKLGAEVILSGPPTLVPKSFSQYGAKIEYEYDKVIEEADVLYLLRIQQERMNRGYFPTIKEYNKLWGLTEKRLEKTKKDVLVMHPGPTNRGVEIDPAVADSERSFILDQVTSGVAVRMALLHLVTKGELDV